MQDLQNHINSGELTQAEIDCIQDKIAQATTLITAAQALGPSAQASAEAGDDYMNAAILAGTEAQRIAAYNQAAGAYNAATTVMNAMNGLLQDALDLLSSACDCIGPDDDDPIEPVPDPIGGGV
jgi:pyruvate/2-oxoacid:ferredoxin oxidoreductase alpha subunit